MSPSHSLDMSKKDLRLHIKDLEMKIRAGIEAEDNQVKLDDIMSKLPQGIQLTNGTVSSKKDLEDTYAPYSDPDGSTEYVFNKVTEANRVKITKNNLKNLIVEVINEILLKSNNKF